MKVLGVRCSNRDYSAVVLSGMKPSPGIDDSRTVRYPAGYSKPQSLEWLLQEIHELIDSHSVGKIAIKADEGRQRSKAHEDRVEHEAIVTLAGALYGPIPVFKKRKSTIAKDLGLKGQAHYLQTQLDTSAIPDYDGLSVNLQDAILTAWSELPDGS